MFKEVAVRNHSVHNTACRVQMLKFIGAKAPQKQDGDSQDEGYQNQREYRRMQSIDFHLVKPS